MFKFSAQVNNSPFYAAPKVY